MSWTTDVRDFHRKIKYPENSFPSLHEPGNTSIQDRIDHMYEELNEYREALDANELPNAIDAMVDLIYLALGTIRMHGVDVGPCWDEVHRANMKKLPGKNWKNTIKPPGWKAPDLEKVIYHDRI